jgi:PAS domain S-box-containing protein
MLGWTQVDFGKLIHPEDLPFAVEQARKKQRGDLDVVLHYEYRLITRGGELKWVDQYSNSIFYGGRPADLITIIDITERKQAEEALSLSRAQLLANLDNTPNVAVQWYDREGQILYWNPASEALYGWKSVEAVGKTLDQLIHTPKEQAGFMNILAEIQAAGKPYGPYEARVHRRDNTNGWVLATTFSIPIQDGQIGFVCMDVDITERKQAEEKLERQNQRLKALREIDTAILAAGSMESIVSAALSHVRELIDCSRSGLALIDWEKNEALNFDVHTDKATSVPKGARTSLTPIQDTLQILSQNQPIMVNDLTILPDPPPLIQALLKEGLRSVCLLPLFSQGALIGTFSMSSEIPGFFDEEKISLGREVANQVAIAITQNDLLEALRQSNVELEEHAVERENLIAELTAKNAELERFTYTVSHDLKSPLVTIKGFLGYLEQDMLTGNIERLRADSKRIGSAVEKMQELLNDLLELSRVGRFINLPEAIPFDELARAAMELVAGHLAEHNVTVQIQPNLPVVNVDRQRLLEVLQNLLDNAAKYMGGQAEPLIEIGQRGEDAEAGQPVFFIKDNGMGVAPEYHERIFGLFNKLDPRSEGTGVGLALVKRIIEVHEGRIWIESELGKGSTFYFTLPVKEVSA